MGVRLRRIVEDVVAFFDRIKPGIHYETGELKLTLGHYHFTLTGFGLTPLASFAADLLEAQVPRVAGQHCSRISFIPSAATR